MKIQECMCKNIVWGKTDDTIYEIAKQMNETHVGCIPICDNENQVVGIITDRDVVLRCIACDKDIKNTTASEIMTTDVYTLKPNDDVVDAIEYMSNWKIKRIPVAEQGILKGIITLGDLAKAPEISDTAVGDTAKNICCGEKHKA